jgi:carboxyl-terminal processing protease
LAATTEKGPEKMGEVATTVARMLESAHYTRQHLNDEVSPGVTQARKALDRYIELLDYNRLFFTQEDVVEFSTKYGGRLQDDILLGNLEPAYTIYDRFISRVESRVGKINKLLEGEFKFDSNRTAQINRDKQPWPANEAEADKIWSARLEAELLQLTLAEKAMEDLAEYLKDGTPGIITSQCKTKVELISA